MSLPIWAKMPVVGAMKPIRSSSAPAVDDRPRLKAAASVPRSSGSASCVTRRVLLMDFPPCFSVALPFSGRGRCQRLHLAGSARLAVRGAELADLRRDSHQPGGQVENGQHVDAAQHILPPR